MTITKPVACQIYGLVLNEYYFDLLVNNMRWCALVVLYIAVSSATNDDEWRLVNTPQGPVRGRREPDGIYAFYNIPYATAPTGENKFKVKTATIL